LDRFVETVGPDKLAERIGPDEFTKFVLTLAGRAKSTLRREIQYVDRLFNWAGPGKRSMNLIPFAQRGPDWIKPSDDEIAGDGDKTYTPAQLRAAFAAVEDNPMLYAAAHLGLNCAFIPIDIGTLPESLLDLESGVIRFPRGKNGIKRLCILLPKTITAIHGWLRQREKLKCQISAAGLLFRTRHGLPLARTLTNEASGSGYDHNALTTTWGRTVGLPFSGLRTTFATLADEWPDQRAIDVVMGHSSGRVSGHVRSIHYAKQINPERVRRLVLHVWPLAFGQGVQNSAAATQQPGQLSVPTSRAG
jgi:integrase